MSKAHGRCVKTKNYFAANDSICGVISEPRVDLGVVIRLIQDLRNSPVIALIAVSGCRIDVIVIQLHNPIRRQHQSVKKGNSDFCCGLTDQPRVLPRSNQRLYQAHTNAPHP